MSEKKIGTNPNAKIIIHKNAFREGTGKRPEGVDPGEFVDTAGEDIITNPSANKPVTRKMHPESREN